MKEDLRNILIVLLTVFFIAVGVHFSQEFRFYNMESSNLFLYDWIHVCDVLTQPGGLAILLASFISQFMCVPYVGTITISLLYMLSAWLMYLILSVFAKGLFINGFIFVPTIFLYLCLENDYYMFQGHIAFIISLVFLYLYSKCLSYDWMVRYGISILMIPILYYLAGSASIVCIVSAILLEVLKRKRHGLSSLLFVFIYLLTSWVFVSASAIGDWYSALTPFMYYSSPSTYFFPMYAWISVPLLIIASFFLDSVFKDKKHAIWVAYAGLLVSFYIAGNFYSKVHSKAYYRLIQEQHWARSGEWDKIIQTADRRQPTYFISYLNLALAQKGELLGRYMYYSPRDLSSLMYPTPNLKTGFSMQSMVYQSWGYHAAARQSAFDANLVTPGSCNPSQLKVLIETNLALGSYEVAEKYLKILDKTLFYREWAQSIRDGISDLVPADLPYADRYVRYDGIKGDMRDILEVNPSCAVLQQFYQLYAILEKEDKR